MLLRKSLSLPFILPLSLRLLLELKVLELAAAVPEAVEGVPVVEVEVVVISGNIILETPTQRKAPPGIVKFVSDIMGLKKSLLALRNPNSN